MRGLRLSTGIFALAAAPSVAWAQDAAAGDAETAGGGSDIVVTAQRRPEQLIDVPLSISVVSGERLDKSNITSSMDLAQVTPGLSIAPLGGFSQPVLRGVSTVVPGVGNPSNVALYIDGVYITAQDAYDFNFLGVDRVEVLKGPQGTLYGRNATGGAILVTTRKPSMDFAGESSLSYGDFNTWQGKMYFSGPITDQLAVSVSGLIKTSDGYMTNITTGNDKVGKLDREVVRAKLLFEPREGIEFQLSGDYSHVDDPTGWLSSTLNRNTQALRTNPTVAISSKPWEVNLTFDPSYEVENSGVSLRGDVNLGSVSFNSVTSYRDLRGVTVADVDYNPLPQTKQERHFFEKAFYQELNLSSAGSGPLNWTIGASYAHEDSRNDPIMQNNLVTARNRTLTNYYSAFADITFELSDQFAIIGGLRYSDESKDFSGRTANAAVAPVTGRITSDAWTPRVSLRFSPRDNVTAYASYNRGFKSGGFNSSSSNSLFNGVVTPFKPEKIDSYEVGLKANLGQGASFDISAYYSDYSDAQVAVSLTTAGVPQQITTNAAAARIWGGEAQLRLNPLPGLNLQFGAAYTNARYTDFPNALVTAPLPGGGNSQFSTDASGYKVVRNPTFTGTISAEYTHPTSFGAVFVSGNFYHSSGHYYGFTNRLHQSPYDLVNGKLGVEVGEHVRVAFWATNLFNEVYATLLLDSPTGDRLIYGAPRTMGGVVEFKF